MEMLRTAVVVAIASVGCGGGGDVPFEVHDTPGASRALWVFAPDDVWVGGDRVLHYDGATWTETAPPTAGRVVALWGLAADDLWAVVDAEPAALIHWDGASWTLHQELPSESAQVLALWASSATDVWVSVDTATPMLQWNGATWLAHDLGRRSPVLDIWASGPSDVWAIGHTFFDEPGLSHWDGATWTHVPGDVSSHSRFEAGWGAAPDDIWFVDSGTWTHYDGAWTSMPRSRGATDMWGFAADDIWAVGSPAGNSGIGNVIRFDGTEWTDRALPSGTSDVHRIHGSSAEDMWLLGQDRVLRLDP